MHKDREWLIPMAAVAAAGLALWLAMYNASLAGSPLVALYNIVEVIGLAGALIPFFLWHLLKLYRQGEASSAKRMARELDTMGIVAIALAMLLGSITAGAFSTLCLGRTRRPCWYVADLACGGIMALALAKRGKPSR